MQEELLFYVGDLSEYLKNIIIKLEYSLKEMPKEEVLGSTEALAEKMKVEFTVVAPKLGQPAIRSKTRTTKEQIDFGRKINIPGLKIDIEIPFEGNGDIFRYCPSTQHSNKPFGMVHVDKICFSVFAPDGNEGQAKQEIKGQVERLNKYLDISRKDIEEYNSKLPAKIRELIKKQKDKIEKDGETIEDLNSFLKEKY